MLVSKVFQSCQVVLSHDDRKFCLFYCRSNHHSSLCSCSQLPQPVSRNDNVFDPVATVEERGCLDTYIIGQSRNIFRIYSRKCKQAFLENDSTNRILLGIGNLEYLMLSMSGTEWAHFGDSNSFYLAHWRWLSLH